MPKILSKEERQEKENNILDQAVLLYDEKNFTEFTMNELAKRCGMAKGTLFNYFPTKETLFARIMYREYDRWGTYELEQLRKYDTFTKEQYQEFIMNQTSMILKKYIRLVRLVSMKRSIINKNIATEILEKEIKGLDQMIKRLSLLTEKRVDFLTKEQIYNLYMTRHVILVGVYSLATSPGNIEKLREKGIKDLAIVETEKTVCKMTKEYLKLYCR